MSQDKPPVKTTVFISYAHGGTLGEQVKELVDWLSEREIKVISDHPYVNRPPAKGWRAWMHHSINQADAVLIVCTARYKQLFQKDEIPERGGNGVTWESAIITNDLYWSYLQNERFYPILPDGGDASHVPDILRDWDNNHSFPSGNARILDLILEVANPDKYQPPPDKDNSNERDTDVTEEAQPTKTSTPKTPSGSRITRAPMEAKTTYDITVRFSRKGNTLHVDYIPADNDLIPGLEHNWSEKAQQAKSILQWLASPGQVTEKATSTAARKEWGPKLFQLLFGDGEGWNRVARYMTSNSDQDVDPMINPVRYPVRLRIATTDPLLLALPWRLTAWNQHFLADRPEPWEFLTVENTKSTSAPGLNVPCEVIIIGSRYEVTDGHCRAVREGFKQDWPRSEQEGYLRFVADGEELREALKGMHPRIVYVHGWAENQGIRFDNPTQPVNDNQFLALKDLAGQLRDNGSMPLLILNTPGPEAAGDIPPSILLGGVVSGLIWTRLNQHSHDMDTFLLKWLHLWREKGGDPFGVLCRAAADGNGHAPALLGCYCTRETRLLQKAGRRATSIRRTLHYLDRKRQKTLFLDKAQELVNQDTRRVMAMAAYADKGNEIKELSTQFKHYLEEHGGERIQFNYRRIEFPIERHQLRDKLEWALKTWLNGQEGEHTRHILGKHMPRSIAAGRPVLWLDWGVFGSGPDRQSMLKVSEIKEWLEFCVYDLCEYCREEHRIVTSISLELAEKTHPDLQDIIKKFKRRFWDSNQVFDFHIVSPLGKVTEDDLLDYLAVEENLKCLAQDQLELTDLIIRETEGDFEPTVRLLEEAQKQGNCFGLLDNLRKSQGAAPDDILDDDILKE